MSSEVGPVVDAWTLFDAVFKPGDEVVLITEDDEVMHGKLRPLKTGVELTWPGRKTVFKEWEDVRFMSHDGFPVKRLMGADGSELIGRLDTKETQKAIRDALLARRCARCGFLVAPGLLEVVKLRGFSRLGRRWPSILDSEQLECTACRKGRKVRRFVFGDPFLVEDVNAILFNPGNVYDPAADNWEFEETILLLTDDGARALLWDVPTCFDFA